MSFVNFIFRREKDNSLFNVSGSDELSLSIICSDDVTILNITKNTTPVNITCAYLFLKADATYGNSSYFRTIQPSYEAFTNITFYMLDLNYDTGVEIVLTINDLTGDYSSGDLAVKRYINGSEVTIMSQPFDIESSVTLYFLKDMYYSIEVTNNDGDIRVIGNIIASSPGEKTLTLPEITFYKDDDIVLGDEVLWNYTYNLDTFFIQLVYYDAGNNTINVSFKIMNESSNYTVEVFSGYTTNSSRAVFTYNLPDENITYMSNLTICHPSFSPCLFEQKIFFPGGEVLEPEEKALFTNIGVYLFWMATIVTFVIGMSFSARTSKIGLPVMLFFLFMFIQFGWIGYGSATWIVFGLFGVLAVLNIFSKSKEVKG